MSVPNRVFIGRLPASSKERDIERFFKGYGNINDIIIKTGFAFVEFEDSRDADDAVYELNNRELNNERVTVEHSYGGRGQGGGYSRGGGGRYGGGGGGGGGRRDRDRYSGGGGGGSSGGGYNSRGRPAGFEKYGPPQRTQYRVIVKNLSTRMSWQDLKDFMRKEGSVTFADAHKTHNREGVVEFKSSRDVKNVIKKLDNMEIYGRNIQIVDDSERHGSSSRSRSRSGSRSRSRSHSRYSRSRSSSRSRSRSRSVTKSPRRSGSE